MAQPIPTSPTGPPPPFPPVATTSTPAPVTPIPIRPSHNDLNDVQNISKILSSIQNGSSSTINTNHNNNHSSDKRLFGDDLLSITKANHKESGVKASDEKNHHRSKRKQKATVVTSSVPTVAPSKQNEHKHTNGLSNSSSEKILGNSFSLLNGDDGYDEEQMDKVRRENTAVRTMVFREIRKPGRDYSGLYKQLEKVKGTFEMRYGFIQMSMDEANRFRRKQMASCIQEWWDDQHKEKNGDATGKYKT